jgi:trehalose 6-phosphate synthase/phosphatase
VIHYHEKYKTTSIERMNLWCLSDAFLDTSVRSGLSLLPFEFLVAQKQNEIQNRDDISRHFGTMIISEFASCSRVLNGSILINPWKAEDIVNAITKCVHMQNHEKRNRFQLNYKFLTLHSDSRWSDHLLADIEASAVQETKDGKDSVEVGFGFDYRVMHFNSSFVKLNVDDLVRKYTKSTRRLFVFDYGGTLSWTASILEEGAAAYHFNPNTGSLEMDTPEVGSREPQAKGFPQHVIRYIDGQVRTPLTSEARDNIRSLCDNPQNIVFIVSTGSRGELDAEFGTMSNLNLIADNGLYFRKARESAWECLCNEQTLDTSWKEEVKKITKAYADRTNGAFIVINEASILYDYRNSDPEYGEIQALELYEQLQQVLKVILFFIVRFQLLV